MFFGQYEHTIDEKGRITIPARFRETLENGAYLTRGFDKNLILLTKDAFEKISHRINQLSITDPNARRLFRLIYSSANEVEFDKIGRILIQGFLREAANLDSAAVVVGAGNYIEIWNPEYWNQHMLELEDTEANNQRFAPLELTVE